MRIFAGNKRHIKIESHVEYLHFLMGSEGANEAGFSKADVSFVRSECNTSYKPPYLHIKRETFGFLRETGPRLVFQDVSGLHPAMFAS